MHANRICVYFTWSICVYFQLNLGILPKCEQYYRQQGYDFKFSNGRVVLVRGTARSARRRRQNQVGHLNPLLLRFSFDQ